MTPGARIAAAIEVLDRTISGASAEKELISWSRRSRFAGSKDRAAVRDLVFDALRKYQTYQALSGQSSSGLSGRSLMIGAIRAEDGNPEDIFNGDKYNPTPLTQAEMDSRPDGTWCSNLPDWVFDALVSDLGFDGAKSQARFLSDRAPITLRVNVARTNRDELQASLKNHGFDPAINTLSDTALTIRGSGRGLMNVPEFQNGAFEMQDAASQALVDALPLTEANTILDFCAGGGGKSLAMAAQTRARISAHDISAQRLKALDSRAARAGVHIKTEPDFGAFLAASFDLVLVDAPCSGSGSWRRAPDAKWRFNQQDLDAFTVTQRKILAKSQSLVTRGGCLAYATCSILSAENTSQRDWFLREFPDWCVVREQNWLVSDSGDGFFLSQFRRSTD